MKYFFVIIYLVLITACSNDNLDSLIVQLRETRNVDTCDGVIDRRADIVRKISKTMNPKAIVPLIEALHSKDEAVFRWGNVCSGHESETSGLTYPSIIKALSNFGPLAQDAIPRLTELLEDFGNRLLTRREILSALEKIAPDKALEIEISVFLKNPNSTHRGHWAYDRPYVSHLLSYEEEICLFDDKLSPIFIKEGAISNVNKATYFIYCSNDARDLKFTSELLMDPKVLNGVYSRSFKGSGNKFLPIVSIILKSFDELFLDSDIPRNSACGGPLTSIEANRNFLRGRLFAILTAICTPESMRVHDLYKKVYKLKYTCGGAPDDCLKKLQMSAANTSFLTER